MMCCLDWINMDCIMMMMMIVMTMVTVMSNMNTMMSEMNTQTMMMTFSQKESSSEKTITTSSNQCRDGKMAEHLGRDVHAFAD